MLQFVPEVEVLFVKAFGSNKSRIDTYLFGGGGFKKEAECSFRGKGNKDAGDIALLPSLSVGFVCSITLFKARGVWKERYLFYSEIIPLCSVRFRLKSYLTHQKQTPCYGLHYVISDLLGSLFPRTGIHYILKT